MNKNILIFRLGIYDPPLDVNSLATLKPVVELGGVEGVGRRLHVGQPAVTKCLCALDKCYGATLMQLQGRQLELTFGVRSGNRDVREICGTQ